MSLIRPNLFPSLVLGQDDWLSTDIVLILGLPYLMDGEMLTSAVEQGLRDFPHLTGELVMQDEAWSIEPSSEDVVVDLLTCDSAMTMRDLRHMTLAELGRHFAPNTGTVSMRAPLLRVKLTRFKSSGMSVLGIQVSHAAVDGAGLALFIHNCVAALRGSERIPVLHDRNHRFDAIPGSEELKELPERYREVPAKLWAGGYGHDPLGQSVPVCFSVEADTICQKLGSGQLLDIRRRFASWLCVGLAELHRSYTEVALWCDARGLSGVSTSYTGNTGCYLHYKLSGSSSQELGAQIGGVATRAGVHRIADTYGRLKRAERAGRRIVWDGPGESVLQLNLLPHAAAGSDFRALLPGFNMMLSRNSSGLRMAITPEGRRVVVEACLPEGLGEALVKHCDEHGFSPTHWCCGGFAGCLGK